MLLIFDVGDAYVLPDSPLYCRSDAALAVTMRVGAGARPTGVVCTRVLHTARGADGLFYRKVPALQAYLSGNPLRDFPASIQRIRT